MPATRRFSMRALEWAEWRDAEKARREADARVLRRQSSFDSIQKALEAAEADQPGTPEMTKRIQDAEEALRKGLDDGVDDETLTAGLARCLALSSAEQAEKEYHERLRAEEEARAKASKAQALLEEKQRKARNELVAKMQKGTLNGSLVTIKGLDGDDAHLNGKTGRVVPRDSFSGTAASPASPLARRSRVIAQQGQGAKNENRDPAEDQGLRRPSTELSSAQVRDLLYDSPTSTRKADEADFMQRLQCAEWSDRLSRDQNSSPNGSFIKRRHSDTSRSASVSSSPNGSFVKRHSDASRSESVSFSNRSFVKCHSDASRSASVSSPNKSFVKCHSWTSPPHLLRPPRASKEGSSSFVVNSSPSGSLIKGHSSDTVQPPRPPHESPENDAKPDSPEKVRVRVQRACISTESERPSTPPLFACPEIPYQLRRMSMAPPA